MKRIAIAATVIFTTGILSFCTKESNSKPSFAMIQNAVFDSQKDLASGD